MPNGGATGAHPSSSAATHFLDLAEGGEAAAERGVCMGKEATEVVICAERLGMDVTAWGSTNGEKVRRRMRRPRERREGTEETRPSASSEEGIDGGGGHTEDVVALDESEMRATSREWWERERRGRKRIVRQSG
ncbi:hypothetical protein E2562_033543 [Oryza meyeriana var. granulata]|uniref:DUF834 domain-containing protein n=1 Tax=Oryza meyeriana var. granulata TaxID=110450 RepID=A0A6G1ES92_9ORYZ|nr:hypothetical protein E2562_033543 [Oryza meyeriana var. granulata]